MKSYTSFFLHYYFKKHIGFLWGSKLTAADQFWKIFYRLQKVGAIEEVANNSQNLTAKITVNQVPLAIQIRHSPCSDILVYRQIFAEGEYKALLSTLHQYHCKPALIVDAGANVGYTTLFLLAHFRQSHVLCIEPDAANVAQIVANTVANNWSSVEVVKAGVWSHNCWLKLNRDKSNGQDWGFYVTESDTATDLPAIDILQLPTVQQAATIDLLKMDIEGSEAKIFDNPAYASALLAKTRFIAMEIHDDMANRKHIQEQLSHNGFSFYENGELTIGVNLRLMGATA
jgi:FkbM family methyltransferase